MTGRHTKLQSLEALDLAEALLADAFDSALIEKCGNDAIRSKYLNTIMQAFESVRTARKVRRYSK